MLECYFQLVWLFEDNEERKALQFLYHNEIRLREFYEKLAFPEKDGSFFQKLKNDKHLKGVHLGQNQKKIYLENIRKIDETLNVIDYKEIANDYERTEWKKSKKPEKKGKVSYWYELFDGPTSIDGLATKLKEAGLYEFIYRNCSSYAHGEDIVHPNLESLGKDTMGVSALRDLRQLEIIVDNVILLIRQSSLLFLKHKIFDNKLFTQRLLLINDKVKNIRIHEVLFGKR